MDRKKLFSLLRKLDKHATDEIRGKALALWLLDRVVIDKQEDKIIGIVLPITGYNKKSNIVVIGKDVICYKHFKSKLKLCDGFRKNKVCSHSLATLYKLLNTTGYYGKKYYQLRKIAESWISRFKNKNIK